MIINQNSISTIILTLSERVTLSSPYFLFDFESHSFRERVQFISADISSATTRYNQFNIIETGSTYVNHTSGIVNLEAGQYTYRVFEQTSPTNLSLSSTGGLLETGLIFVSASTRPIEYKPVEQEGDDELIIYL